MNSKEFRLDLNKELPPSGNTTEIKNISSFQVGQDSSDEITEECGVKDIVSGRKSSDSITVLTVGESDLRQTGLTRVYPLKIRILANTAAFIAIFLVFFLLVVTFILLF